MGSEAQLIVDGDGRGLDAHLGAIRDLLVDLEQRWSRFLPASELSHINASSPEAVPVRADTFEVIETAIEAWRLTAGAFDPCVGSAMARLGYDRSFDDVRAGCSARPVFEPARGAGEVRLDREGRTVAVPAGCRLDLGGIGKGRAADLAVGLARSRGITSSCVNVGGDARAIGGASLDAGWVIAIEDPFDCSRPITTVALTDGAVVTSARTRRHWKTDAGEVHHLVDPRTGAPARTGLAQVTVLAADATWAEVIAKAAFVAGRRDGPALVASSGASALFVTDDGERVRCGDIERFER
jgi:thiamine biosynthesis lipoprotein